MKTETYVCHGCNIDVVRPAARGQRPKWCPDCRTRGAWNLSTFTCAGCGQAAIGHGSKYCSVQCAARVNGAARRKPATPKPPRPEPQPKFCRIFTPTCVVCDRVFVTRHTTITCSTECKEVKRLADKREAKHRRRARERLAYRAPVFRLAIYKRDAWTCGICGDPVNPAAVAPELDAPTIDHVVPLSKGGTHEPSNVQTAHFYCNSVKADRSAA